jgi:hypothetical protein
VKKLLVMTAALAAAVAVWSALTLPPRRLTLVARQDGTIPGIIHVHTNRSDGLSGPDEIAAAAARAGLAFVVFTDHGDGTRAPDPPSYRAGVLCLDGVEISTTGGHYVALDMAPSPYPLGGEARDVVEDVRRLGGFGIAAHPDSPKPQLQWREWTAPFDAMELLNPDTSWRVLAATPGWAPKRHLLEALIGYPFRPQEVLAGLIQPTTVLDRWETLTRQRRVVAVAGADAHARLALRNADPGNSRYVLPLPGYESSFRLLSLHVRPDRPLSGRAGDDAALLVRAIRAGHAYTAVDGVATPASFDFTATNALGTVHAGDELGVGGPVSLSVRSNAPPGFTTIIHEGGRVVASQRDSQDVSVDVPERPGVYWAEIVATGRPRELTWVRGNPIYLRRPEPAVTPAARPPATASVALFDGSSIAGWRVEQDPSSLAAVDLTDVPGGKELRFRFGLAGGSPAGQVAALAFDIPAGLAPYDRLSFSIRAERPMRVSIQLRAEAGEAAGERWQRSVYVDTSGEPRAVSFNDVAPVGEARTIAPPLDGIRSLLFVVDTTNSKPGVSGRIWISRAALQR